MDVFAAMSVVMASPEAFISFREIRCSCVSTRSGLIASRPEQNQYLF